MTRDEAVQKANSVYWGNDNPGAILIDRLVALELLKLDEPKSVEDRIKEMMEKFCIFLSPSEIERLKKCAAEAGLKIVDARSQGEG